MVTGNRIMHPEDESYNARLEKAFSDFGRGMAQKAASELHQIL